MSVIYIYDETLAGLLSCVFESYQNKELPEDLLPEGTPSLYFARRIATDREKAARVWRGLKQKGEAAEWVRLGWLSCVPERGRLLFAFIRAAFTFGAPVCGRTADPAVTPVYNAVRFIKNEAHFICQFLRFSDYQGVLASQITPKAMVLPLIKEHFTDRLAGESFLIHDLTHGQALIYQGGKTVIREIESLELDAPGETERAYRKLWRRYYKTIAIESRYNPKCRMTHMPKRYWGNMTEFQDEPAGPPIPEKTGAENEESDA